MNHVKTFFNKSNSITLDKFITKALYDKKYGYYMKRNPFGLNGDFITAPLISNLFGEMIALWCVAFWEKNGKPNKINFLELGPGDGSLCKTIIKTSRNFPNFYNSINFYLYEISSHLKQIQKTNIASKKVKWIKNLSDINSGPTIFFGNEFFDSLPIKQFSFHRKYLFEKFVTLTKKNVLKFTFKKTKKKNLDKFLYYKMPYKKNLIEYPIITIHYLKTISSKINKYGGALLVFDYGYNKKNCKNTLQSVRKHKFSNILSKVSTSDITSHVNFKLMSNVLKKENLNVEKIVNQNYFLQKMGIVKRANIIARNLSFKDKANLYYRLKRLLDVKYMGSLFKVLLAQKKEKKFSIGFN